MEAVGAAASIIGIIQLAGKIAALGYGYIGSVARASEDVESLISEVVSLRGVLVKLQGFIDSNSQSTVSQTFDAPLQGCSRELQKLESKLKSISGVRKRLGRILGSLKWPFTEAETLQILAQIERHKSTLVLALDIDHIALSRSIQGDVKDVGSSVQVLHHELRAESAAQSTVRTDERRKAVLHWLYPKNTHTKHTEISKRRQGNTGQWLLRSPQYQDWVDGQGSKLLWGYGIPGAGKTFLSSRVIDNFQETHVEENGLAYIYFDYKERDHQTPERILASLIKQLAYQRPTLHVDLEKLCEKLESEGGLPTTHDLYKVLVSILNCFGRVFLIFDALDECDQKTRRNTLLPLFHQMGKDGFNLFLTSRQYPEDIQKSFRDVAKIELSAQDGDIRVYVQEKINENPRAKSLVEKAKCKEEIVSELIACANGMFLLVKFHIEYLCQQTTPNQLKLAIKALKASSATGQRYPLDPTYDRVMETLQQQPECCVLAMKVFAWLVKARRTLTIQELEIAISVEPGCFELDQLNLPDRETILDVCGGLVIIDDSSKTIRLAHLTVQEYLLRKSKIPKEMDIALAITCITYLSLEAFSSGACKSDASVDSRLESYPFMEYAAQYFPSHLRLCEEHLSKDAIIDFLERSGNVCSWMQVVMYLVNEKSVGDAYHERFLIKQIPLHIASAIGNTLVVLKLLEEGANINERVKSTGVCALSRAVMQGHEGVTRVLLERGADISAQDDTNWTALHRAASYGHQKIVQLLLEKGADISAQDANKRTALHCAASSGHQAVVQLLLENGADISAQDKGGQTALHLAASGGSQAVAQLLLENGADISAQDTSGWTALHLAAWYGSQAVVQLLLENGADISAQDTSGWTALHLAVWYGRQAVVQLLLENGADISAQDTSGRTALHLVAKDGNQAVVQLLLENGADISAQDTSGWTALHLAVWYRRQAVVQLLLENGADISSQDTSGQTALHLAAKDGNPAVAQLLLENGADISAQDTSGQTALHLAASRGRQAVVQLLLKNGADISAQDTSGQTALHLAVKDENQAVVQLLLENGADISAQDTSGQTALRHAEISGYQEIVMLLLGKGVGGRLGTA